jgi:hypothetical protein
MEDKGDFMSKDGRYWLGLFAILIVGFLAAILLMRFMPVHKVGKVSGTVVVSGQPLTEGVITFIADDPHGPVAGAIVVDGEYEVPLVPVGPYTVTVDGKGVPPKYSVKAKSELRCEVVEGESRMDFYLGK